MIMQQSSNEASDKGGHCLVFLKTGKNKIAPLEGEEMPSETQKGIHRKEGEDGGYKDLGHGESIKMDLETEDGRGSLLAYWDFIASV